MSLGKTHQELISSITHVEYLKWRAFYELHPWGDRLRDASIALAGSAVCASMGSKVEPKDLLPIPEHYNETVYNVLSASGELMHVYESEMRSFGWTDDFIERVKASNAPKDWAKD